MERAELLALLAAINGEIRARGDRGDVGACLELRWRVLERLHRHPDRAPCVERRLLLAIERDHSAMQ